MPPHTDGQMILVISPLTEYILNHLQIVAWPTIVALVARVCFRIGRFFTILEARIIAHETSLTRISTVDVPEIKSKLQTLDNSVLSLREVVIAHHSPA